MDSISVNLFDLLKCLSHAQDLVNIELANHHHQVAYLAFKIADTLNIGFEEKQNILLAGLLHDIGALAMNERLAKIDDASAAALNHGYIGSMLLSGFKPLEKAAEIVKYHHSPWNDGKNRRDIPFGSHIIHLADRICVELNQSKNALPQIHGIAASIRQKKGTFFAPELVDCFEELKSIEYIWLDLLYANPMDQMPYQTFFNVEPLGLDQIIDFSKIFSRIIDFRSSFTANHSAGVARTAERLAQIFGYSENECKMMLVAGYLHDLGKLAIDNAILDKPAALTPEEFSTIKCHPFYTHRILNVISGFDTISKWASYHHERLDGRGYPFHLDDRNLPLGSKIVAVADVFTAITEDRPYRKGMEDQQCISVLHKMTAENALSSQVVTALLDNFGEMKEIRRMTQELSAREYSLFRQEHLPITANEISA